MRIGGRIWSRRWRLLVCGASAVCFQQWRTYTGHFKELSREEFNRSTWKLFSLPKVIELVIPTPFLKATTIDGADAIVHAVDADFIGSEPDSVAEFDVSGMYGAIFLVSESLDEYPKG